MDIRYVLSWRKWSSFNCCRRHLKYPTVFLHNEEVVQECLGQPISTTWKNSLKKYICTNQWKTTVKVGNWRVSSNDLDQLWPYYYAQAKYILYKSYPKNWFSNIEYEYIAIQYNLPDIYIYIYIYICICFNSSQKCLLQSIWATFWCFSLWFWSLQKWMENH